MKKLLIYLKGYRVQAVMAPLFKMLEALFELFVPLVIAEIIDTGITRGDKAYIMQMSLLLVALGVVGLISSVTAQYFAAKAAVGFSARLRHALMAHMQGLSYTEIDTLGTSAMITRMTSDINQLQNGVNMTLRLILRSPFIVIGAAVMAFTIDVKSALVFICVIPVLSLAVWLIMSRSMPVYKKVQGSLDGVTSAARENLSGVRVIRAFCKEEEERQNFDKKTDALTKFQFIAGRISALMNPVTYLIINAAIIILIYTGAVQVNSGALTQGQVIALYNYMSQILIELIKFANLMVTITRAAACGNRVAGVFDIKSSQKNGGVRTASGGGSVEFKNVSLRYKGAGDNSLTGISFAAHAGETVGIIGPTGAGKSSVVNLIPRFYDATGGEVIVDGVNVNDYDVEALRKKCGVVPQKAVLFRGTIRSNLLWGNENATEEELYAALKTAQALEIAEGSPDGLERRITQGGDNLSGGQRQRLTIARALVRRPEILILDDSASALDFATDANLRMALRELDYNPTVFIVSQRVSSVMYADRIMVIEDGVLAGTGTHLELMETCGLYREIANSQLREGR